MLNIIAMAPWCPPRNLKGKIWSINNSHAAWKREGIIYKPDLIIAMDDLRRDEIKHPDYVEEIVTAGCPVLSTHDSEKWETVKAFPLDTVYKVFTNTHLFDNTINYAFMLALVKGYKEITFHGTDFVSPDSKKLLSKAGVNWLKRGYRDVPDWFKYYDEDVIHWRGGNEPGVESFHYLMGRAEGVKMFFAKGSTALNMDRDSFFYGYQEQPEI